MIRTLDLVALLADLPESKLRRGDVGIVIRWHITEARYDVEFGTTTEREVTLVTLREDQLLKLNQAREELSLYAPLAEHWQKVVEVQFAECEPELEEAHESSLVRVPANIRLHDLLHLVCIHRPTDFAPYGIRQREAADCSCGCKHFIELAGGLGADWGVCANPHSPRAGLLTFEHQGCEFFEYDERIDEESEPRDRNDNPRRSEYRCRAPSQYVLRTSRFPLPAICDIRGSKGSTVLGLSPASLMERSILPAKAGSLSLACRQPTADAVDCRHPQPQAH